MGRVTNKIYCPVFDVLEDVHGKRVMSPDDVYKISILIKAT